MNITELKTFTYFYIDEHNLPKNEKQILINFVKEAEMDQVLYLLQTGRVKTNLTEDDRKMVNEVTPDITLAAGVLGAVVAAIAAKAAYRAAQLILSKAQRACRKYTGNERQKCIAKYKKQAAQKKVQVLQSYKSKCSKAKDPEKCITNLNKKIEKAKKEADQITP